MKNISRLILVLLLVLLSVSLSYALIVVDAKGKAVSGAKVYAVYVDQCAEKVEIEKTTVTDEKGQFSFSDPIKSSENTIRYFVAYKPGEYIGWVMDKSSMNNDYFKLYVKGNFDKIALKKFKTLSGKITSKSGSPIKDVNIEINTLYFSDPFAGIWGGLLKEFGVPISVKSDSKGNYIFKNVPDGANASITIKKSGFATNSINMASNIVNSVLEPECKILGKIVDENGKPVTDAKIIAYDKNFMNRFYSSDIKSGKDGTFEISGLNQGTYEINVSQDDYCNYELDDIKTIPGKNVKLKSIVLKKGIELSGKVFDEETGNGVPGISLSVSLNQGDSSESVNETTSDANGQYKVMVLPGQLSIFISGKSKDLFPKNSDMEVTVGDKGLANFDIPFGKGIVLSGKVVDENDNPVIGAIVTINEYGEDSTNKTTDNEGKFTINTNPDRNYGTKVIKATDPSTGKAGTFAISNDNPVKNNFVITLKPTYSVSVLVKNKSGKAVPYARVSIVSVYSEDDFSLSSSDKDLMTDSKGICVFEKLVDGPKYKISANKAGYFDDTDKRKPISAKNSSKRVEIVLLPANRTQRGRVIDIYGKPVANATVTYNTSGDLFYNRVETKTDKKGKFVIKNLPDAPVKLMVLKGNLVGSLTVSKYTKDVVIQISKNNYGW